MEAVLARPHAVTCLLAALELKSRRVQREVLELLLRVALTPQGTAKLLASCEVLRHAETDERRLARLCGLLACGATVEFEVGVLHPNPNPNPNLNPNPNPNPNPTPTPNPTPSRRGRWDGVAALQARDRL